MSQRTIVLKGKLGRRYEEARLSVAAYPGYLMEMATGADAGKYKPHATAGGKAIPVFLVEDDYQGKTIDDQYAIGDLGRFVIADVGDVINAVLTTSQTIAVGDYLESAGNGQLRVLASGVAIARAEAAVTTTASADFIPVQILGAQ